MFLSVTIDDNWAAEKTDLIIITSGFLMNLLSAHLSTYAMAHSAIHGAAEDPRWVPAVFSLSPFMTRSQINIFLGIVSSLDWVVLCHRCLKWSKQLQSQEEDTGKKKKEPQMGPEELRSHHVRSTAEACSTAQRFPLAKNRPPKITSNAHLNNIFSCTTRGTRAFVFVNTLSTSTLQRVFTLKLSRTPQPTPKNRAKVFRR